MANQPDHTWTLARTNEEIQDAVQKLAREISLDYVGRQPLVLITTARLSSVLFFLHDLGTAINPALQVLVGLVDIRENPMGERELIFLDDAEELILHRHVLVLRPLMTTGETLRYLKEQIAARGAASVKTCILLHKAWRQAMITPDYVGFDVASSIWLAGYGLADDQGGRRLLDHLVKRV